MKNKMTIRILSALLTMALFIEMTLCTPLMMVYGDTDKEERPAGEETEEQGSEEDEGSLNKEYGEEDIVEKGEDYTVFENPDGSRTLKMYTTEVRVEDENGELQDIDNALKASGPEGSREYHNIQGFAEVMLPEQVSPDHPVKLKYGTNEITLAPLFLYGEEAEATGSEESTDPDAAPSLASEVEEEVAVGSISNKTLQWIAKNSAGRGIQIGWRSSI